MHLQIIQRFVPKAKDTRVLDLACGNGRLVHNLKSRGYARVKGVDFSEQQVAVAHAWGITEVTCQDVVGFLLDQPDVSWDVVFAMDFLEHLNKQVLMDLVDQVRRVLVPGGIFIVQVPNGSGLFGASVLYGDLTHVQAFTDRSLSQLMNACGFGSVKSHELKPVVHGVKSLLRYVVWQVLTVPMRLLGLAETGNSRVILSRNILSVAVK